MDPVTVLERTPFRTATAAALAFALSSPAHAAWEWLRTEPVIEFTEADWTLLRQAAARALEEAGSGEAIDWRNPDSGNGGRVGVLVVLELEGHECKALGLEQRVAGEKAGETTSLLCDVDGQWLLTSPTTANRALADEG